MAKTAAARLVRMQIIGALRSALRSIRELTVLPQPPPGLPSRLTRQILLTIAGRV